MSAPRGRPWPTPEPAWFEDPHPGMLLRTAELDAAGKVVPGSEKLRRVPLDRELQAALDWAASVYS